jgi:hypothetical protein
LVEKSPILRIVSYLWDKGFGIKDNDNYKPHAKYYSNPSMFTRLSHKQGSVMADSRYFYIPHRYRGGIKIYIIKYGGSRDCMVLGFNENHDLYASI